MKTKLRKKTTETVIVDGQEVQKVIGLEISLMDDDETTQIGEVNTTNWGGNFSINAGTLDAEVINNAIMEILKNTAQ